MGPDPGCAFDASIVDLKTTSKTSGFVGNVKPYIGLYGYTMWTSRVKLTSNPLNTNASIRVTGAEVNHEHFSVASKGLVRVSIRDKEGVVLISDPKLTASRADDKMISSLLQLYFVGDKRSEITSMEKTDTQNGVAKWTIKTNALTIKLDIAEADNAITGVSITDDLYTYAYVFSKVTPFGN